WLFFSLQSARLFRRRRTGKAGWGAHRGLAAVLRCAVSVYVVEPAVGGLHVYLQAVFDQKLVLGAVLVVVLTVFQVLHIAVFTIAVERPARDVARIDEQAGLAVLGDLVEQGMVFKV